MQKEEQLESITREIVFCTQCKKTGIGKPVPGEGSPNASIMFVGEAPGRTEAQTGRPFVGRSGLLLRELIRSIGLKEEEVYITSPVKYLPKSGTPTPAEILHGRTHLLRQIDIIDPRVVVLLGSVAVQGILQEKLAITKEHGKIIEKDHRKYLLTFHPAAALRFAKYKPLLVKDFEKLKAIAYL